MDREVRLVKAFTKDKNQGNPAGVLLDTRGLSDLEMMHISAQLGFSESAFVTKSDVGDYKVRFFTPTQEVELCGHATIATFHTLFETGGIDLNGADRVTKTQESKAGILPVTIYKDGLVVMTQPNPQYLDLVPYRLVIADLLRVKPTAIMEKYPLEVVSTGSPKMMIPVLSRKFLFDIDPDFVGIAEYCQKNKIKGFYPFTLDTMDPDSDFHARQFNPLAGINEDPITGVAAGALGTYAVRHQIFPKQTKFVVEQGYKMKKAGKIYVEIGQTVQVGGYAVPFGNQTFTL